MNCRKHKKGIWNIEKILPKQTNKNIFNYCESLFCTFDKSVLPLPPQSSPLKSQLCKPLYSICRRFFTSYFYNKKKTMQIDFKLKLINKKYQKYQKKNHKRKHKKNIKNKKLPQNSKRCFLLKTFFTMRIIIFN